MVWIGKALELKPNNAYFINNRGYLYLLKNDLTSALADIDRSISEDPYNAWAYRNKGIYYLKVKDAASAIRLLERAGQMDASIDRIDFFLGEAFYQNGEKQKACAYYRKAMAHADLTQAEYNRMCDR
jgi:tetratricopeptide (TPR) repeat protein